MQTHSASYGSDQQGLIWGYHFKPDTPARPINAEEAVNILSASRAGEAPSPEQGEELEPQSNGDFVWLHFSLSNTVSVPWLRKHLRLPQAFYESIGSEVGSTRLEQEDDALIAVVHDLLFDFSFDPAAISTTSLCIKPNLLVSVRLKPLRSIDHLRPAVRKGETFRSTTALLGHLLESQAGVLVDVLRRSTVHVDRVEDRLLAHRIGSSGRSELGTLRRTLVRLQRLLAPEPAALFRLLNRPPHWITEEDVRDLQAATEEFATAIGDSGALVERIKLLQQELSESVNEQTNRTLAILTVVTVLALPANIMAGLFGMNVGGVPMEEYGHGFFVVLMILVLLTTLLAYLAINRFRE
ncbi:transporter [Marinobacterium lutimaris]|uniref:Zinc transporter n=1 Tax=Marinobacterium lutimaris TaxID=568106 RepID=A0A1H6C9D9_9GAMM|nr:transporter [Marinobacterium lutimaris]SEG69522.1 zinc transporter [Marinobacterium lutimaris]